MRNILHELKRKDHPHVLGAFDIFKYIGPGLLVTVGFIDPGNWASNFAAGSEFGYALLWVVTLSTIMLIALQHNVAHLGIVTGLCLSEAAVKFAPRWLGRPIVAGRDFRRSYRTADAFRHCHSYGSCTHDGRCAHHAFHQ